MDIRTKRVYAAASNDDGRRVLVDRIWPRGLTKEEACLDDWRKEVAPSTELRQWFGHDPAKWEEFRQRYGAELDAHPTVVAELLAIAGQERITLLFAARDVLHNNAVALREYLEAMADR